MKLLLKGIILCLLATSCSTKKQVLYFQDIDEVVKTVEYPNSTIQVNDLLKINVSALEPTAAEPYNKRSNVGVQSSGGNSNQANMDAYLVSTEYTILFPILGYIDVRDKTTTELEKHITNLLVEGGHLKAPTVSVRIVNGKFTVLGEVKSPGMYTFDEQSITLTQALGMAGDLTIKGKRKDIVVIREESGIREVAHIDMTSTDWFNSPFYYIKQNDVIVVDQNYSAVKKAGIIGDLGALLGIVSFSISLALLLSR
ncbi:polysaccharide biosynthesis/export family protein [Mangrovimonas sp. YM274]|uniref:polysaccharide biosynthesis/export family protein n=1 Tax=Mangrovimonas sp. YM274 TaxID=3070660 RepID=UPI0027DBD71E|nr:polysaccharide biosynthesis/export family protein [Mangrovimonas sp. YM274]WMI68434.1 polysaccharide biosynthesis/export family protein [Mangrovimonas sp. YM274]